MIGDGFMRNSPESEKDRPSNEFSNEFISIREERQCVELENRTFSVDENAFQ